MMKSLKIFLFTLLMSPLFLPVLAQENSKDAVIMNNKRYNIDYLEYFSGNQDSTLLNIFVQVPYKEVQFYKNNNSYVANYSVNISIMNDDKEKLISEQIWDEKIKVSNFNQTLSKKNYSLSLKTFKLTPDDYYIRTTVTDNNSENEYTYEKKLEVRKFSNQFDVSDIMLISERKKEGAKIIPNISREVVAKDKGLPVFFIVNSEKKCKAALTYDILNMNDRVVYHRFDTLDINNVNNKVYHIIYDSSLSLGSYKIRIKVRNLDLDKDVETSKIFTSRWAGIPSNVTNLDLAIEQLMYIATDDEMDSLKSADTRKEKVRLFTNFWKRRDPNPSDAENQAFDEYYRRIAYANIHFSHYVDGWKTDMGMVFIVLGPPDDIEHHPFDRNSKPYQVWDYYSLDQSFGFIDETGFGDYRLVNTQDFDYVRQKIRNNRY